MRAKQRGAVTIEMTLIGIPMIFILISIFEISRGMWIYGTLSHAAREGTRYISVHGLTCQTAPNHCGIRQADIGDAIHNAATGMIDEQVSVSFLGLADDFTCTLKALRDGNCKNASVTFIPSTGGNGLGAPIRLTLTYPFISATSLFWPTTGNKLLYGGVTLPATSQDRIQF